MIKIGLICRKIDVFLLLYDKYFKICAYLHIVLSYTRPISHEIEMVLSYFTTLANLHLRPNEIGAVDKIRYD